MPVTLPQNSRFWLRQVSLPLALVEGEGFPAHFTGDAFIRAARDDFGLPVKGLMCIPPVEGDPRPHFAYLANLAAKHGLPILSMGMSGDFEAAIAEGATHVRIGSAIFGARG